jgi:hypothetical protein
LKVHPSTSFKLLLTNYVQLKKYAIHTIVFCNHLGNAVEILCLTANIQFDLNKHNPYPTKNLELVFNMSLGSNPSLQNRFGGVVYEATEEGHDLIEILQSDCQPGNLSREVILQQIDNATILSLSHIPEETHTSIYILVSLQGSHRRGCS